MKQLALITLVLAAWACGGGGGAGKDACVDTLKACADGGTATCLGSYARTCSEDGLAFHYDYCFQALCKAGSCANPACVDPGKRSCKDSFSVQVCAEDLSTLSTEACPSGTKCVGGACVDDNCEAGDLACGWGTVLECVGSGSWFSNLCPGGGLCDPKTKTCLTAHPFCKENPLGQRCEGPTTTLVCAPGALATFQDCASDEVCVDGFCQQRVCGIPYYPDSNGGGQDGGPNPEDNFVPDLSMETISLDFGSGDLPPQHLYPEGSVTLNGGDFVNELVEFDSSSKAYYYGAKKTLQVNLSKDTYQVELLFEGVSSGQLGGWNSSNTTKVRVKVRFNDGSQLPGELQWKYEAKTYFASLTEFGPAKDGWVAGTFTAVLEDQTGGPAIELSNGTFTVPRKE